MVSRSDVDALTEAQRRLVSMARADLARLATVLPPDPVLARETLLDVVPMLVREYGDIAATAAAEWYERVHPGTFLARTADSFPAEGVEQGVRYFSGHLFDGEPGQTIAGLNGAVQRYIAYSGRATIARNVQLDPSRPRFARVPTGAYTCAWCALLASRGWVYHSRETAGEFDQWHTDCDCQVVPSFDAQQTHIDGYDPDRLYEMYQSAWSEGATDEEVAYRMRRMFPDVFTDGVHTH